MKKWVENSKQTNYYHDTTPSTVPYRPLFDLSLSATKGAFSSVSGALTEGGFTSTSGSVDVQRC